MNVLLTTYSDLIYHATDYLGSNASGDARTDARRAVQAAYRDLQARHRWTYYFCRGRLNTVAPYSTGTVAYDHTGGTYERMLTLSSGTWPSWIAQGVVSWNNITYEVDTRQSDAIITLTRASNPGADVDAGTTYTAYQDTYLLPVDLLATDRLILLTNNLGMVYEHPRDWLERQRIFHSPATPRTYTFRGAPGYMGSLAASFFPPPDNIYGFDFMYQRRGRPMAIDGYSTGKVAVTNGQATATGTGTTWTSRMVGACIRIGPDGLNIPTGLAGSYPALYERVILSVESDTSLTMDAVADQTLTGLSYVVSDPADLDEAVMLTALQRGIEYQVSLSRNMKTKDSAERNYNRALIEAMEVDSKSSASENEGPRYHWPTRMAQMPRGSDVG